MHQKVTTAREGYIPVTGGLIWYKIVNPDKNALPLLTLHGGPRFPHDYLEPLEDLADECPIIFYLSTRAIHLFFLYIIRFSL